MEAVFPLLSLLPTQLFLSLVWHSLKLPQAPALNTLHHRNTAWLCPPNAAEPRNNFNFFFPLKKDELCNYSPNGCDTFSTRWHTTYGARLHPSKWFMQFITTTTVCSFPEPWSSHAAKIPNPFPLAPCGSRCWGIFRQVGDLMLKRLTWNGG